MANGEIVGEIRALLASNTKIPPSVAMRLTLAAVADLYEKFDRLDGVQPRMESMEKRVNGWSLVNSLGVVAAGILAFLK